MEAERLRKTQSHRKLWSRLTFGLRIFDRYIGRQAFTAALTGVIVLTGVLVLGNIFKKLDQLLGDTSLPTSAILKFILYIIPYSLIFTIPWAFLTGILLVFGRMSADNEMTALRMTGMSMPRICAPVFVMAIGFCAICYYVNIDVAPASKAKIKGLFLAVALDNPAELFQEGKVFDQLPAYRIYTRKRDGNKLYDVQIFKTSGGKKESYIRASRAEVQYVPGQMEFGLELTNALQSGGRAKAGEDLEPINDVQDVYFGVMHMNLSLKEMKERLEKVNTSMKATDKLWEEVRTHVDSATGLEMGSIPEKPFDNRLKARLISSALTEISMRYSMSIACFTFCVIGIPLGITAQRRETSVGFVLSLAVAFTYMGFIIFAQTLNDKPGSYPHLLMWVPNVAFLAVGGVLFYRLSRK
jgi:lipopolysaccharide export LptBFGC system permease protein LptF